MPAVDRHHDRGNRRQPVGSVTVMERSAAGMLAFPRVLVADDDPLTGQLLTSISGAQGYKVVVVRDGREAYRILKLDSDFQAAIFNMAIPHLEGVDLVRHMKTEKRLQRIPVIVVGGEHDIKGVVDSFAAGALAYLPKPLTADRLQRTLRLAMSSSREARHQLRPAA
jgi:DNA-binding response OmpR family regulator